MPKCQVCQKQERSYTWQPFGPGEGPLTFTLPGSHYRGFPTVAVCDDCKAEIETGNAVVFNYRGTPYYCHMNQVGPTPF